MKGSHSIIVETERMKYEFTVRRNITVILGDSATGKTTLVEFLNMYARRGEGSGVSIQSDVPCVVFTAIAGRWKTILEEIHNCIIFIDEGQSFIFSQEFAEAVHGSDNYFVLITRRPLYNIPYSTKEIYGIRTTGKYHFPEKVYQEFYPIYNEEVMDHLPGQTVLMLEDSGAGYDFFKRGLPCLQCVSAEGNSKIAAKLGESKQDGGILVIADGAAFGAYIESIISVKEIKKNVGIYLPESFEWLILKSGVINKTEISEILAHPEDYVDSAVYLSWERFFTDLLEKETADDAKMRYNKSRLLDFYISDHNVKKVLEAMPDDVRRYLEHRNL